MRNPSQSFPVSNRADADLAREIAALTASSLRWAGDIVIASADPAFPSRREELLLEVASHQTALALAAERSRALQAERTARIEAESQAERLRVTYEQAPMGIAEADLNGRFIQLN